MKSYVSSAVLAVLLLGSQNSFSAQKFDFKYSFAGEKLSVSQEAPDYYEAMKRAAKSCFSHFKAKAKSSHERGLDLIDVCANPKSS